MSLIALPPYFALKWLLPRLPAFRESHPEVQLHLSYPLESVDVLDPQIQISIKWMHKRQADKRARLLVETEAPEDEARAALEAVEGVLEVGGHAPAAEGDSAFSVHHAFGDREVPRRVEALLREKRWPVRHLAADRFSLEEVFIALVREHLAKLPATFGWLVGAGDPQDRALDSVSGSAVHFARRVRDATPHRRPRTWNRRVWHRRC